MAPRKTTLNPLDIIKVSPLINLFSGCQFGYMYIAFFISEKPEPEPEVFY